MVPRVRVLIKDIIGTSKKEKVLFGVAFFLFLIILVFILRSVWTTLIEERSNDALMLTRVVESGLHGENIKSLDISLEDLDKEEYRDIKNHLMEVTAIHKDVRFAYVLVLRDDKIYFAADSEPTDSEDYSPPGQEYTEAHDNNWAPFEGAAWSIIEDEDRWGKWVSVMVPIKERHTGEIIASLGFDYTRDEWYSKAFSYTFLFGLVTICIYAILIFIYAIVKQNYTIKTEKAKLVLANHKVSEQEALFRAIFEDSPIGISVNDRYGIIDVNAMYQKILGRSEKELLLENWKRFTHPEDLEIEIEKFNDIISGKSKGYKLHKRYIRPDNSTIWANLTVASLTVGNNQEPHYVCLVEDISERVKTEQDLKESERSHTVLLSNLPGMAYRCDYDRNWTMRFVSNGCYDLTGYRPEDLLHNRALSFNDLIDSKYQDYLWQKWQETIRHRAKLKEEYEIITADGEVKWVFEQGQAIFDEVGNVTALEGLLIDITERKTKEEEILYLNYHDHLTGVYNRRYLEQKKKDLSKEDQLPLSVIIGDINGVKLVNDAFGHAEGDVLILATAKTIASCCREQDVLARTGGDEFTILLPRTDRETAFNILRQIKAACEQYNLTTPGDSYSVSISLGFHTQETVEEDLDDVMKIAEDNMYKRKLLEHKSSHSVILSSIRATMHERSHETQEHAERLAFLSKKIGNQLGLPEEKLDELVLLATLHDIGKVGIDDSILNKKDRLTEEEWHEMKKHSEIGYRIAMSSPDLVPIAEYILCLHERWDGKGYPQGIKEKEIPLLSRVVSVVDAFDAMTEDRAYRKAMSQEEAIEELKRNAGTQFDPQMVEIFLKVLE